MAAPGMSRARKERRTPSGWLIPSIATVEEARKHAHDVAAQGWALLALAMNWANRAELPYRFSAEALAEMEALGRRYHELVSTARIELRRGAIAQANEDFQRFLIAATGEANAA